MMMTNRAAKPGTRYHQKRPCPCPGSKLASGRRLRARRERTGRVVTNECPPPEGWSGGARSCRAPPDHCSLPVSYTHLRAHETRHDLVCRLLLEKKKKKKE